jgi:SAM-dependent methyltransferase
MTWNLDLKDVYWHVFNGPDDEKRKQTFQALINHYVNPQFRCLQVGVNYPHHNKFAPNFVSIDLYDKRPCIDLNCSLDKLPFQEEFDFIVCNAILEHVKDPFACAREMYRVAKPGCRVWAEVPFVQPFHP